MSGIQPETTRTINVTAAMSTAQIQSQLDGIGKYIPYGVTVTVSFAAGTYTLTAPLTLDGFFGGGTVRLLGDATGGPVRHTTQTSILTTQAANTDTLYVRDCDCLIRIDYLRITPDATGDKHGVEVNRSRDVAIRYCYFLGNNVSAGHGVMALTQSQVTVEATQFTNIGVGFSSIAGAIGVSNGNASSGTGNGGLYVDGAAIFRMTASEPTPVTNNRGLVP